MQENPSSILLISRMTSPLKGEEFIRINPSPFLLFSKKTSPLEGEEFLRKVMMSTGGCYA
jgi:hypothetical protein